MIGSRFDTISKLFAERRLFRRQALDAGGAGIGAAGLGTTMAQVKVPTSETPTLGTADPDETSQYLFVQSYASGSLITTDEPGRYIVPLQGGAGQAVYFSNRPGPFDRGD